jgi:hypothetical protein
MVDGNSVIEPIDRFLPQDLNGRLRVRNLRALADAHHRAGPAAFRVTDQPGPYRRL